MTSRKPQATKEARKPSKLEQLTFCRGCSTSMPHSKFLNHGCAGRAKRL